MSQLRQPLSVTSSPVTRALREGKVCVGALSITYPTPATAQIAAEAGFSWFYFDMEHSGLATHQVEAVCTAAKFSGIVPIAGTTSLADFLVARPLDNGAMGIIVPHVSTRQETELVVKSARYAPVGSRGMAGYGAHSEYRTIDLQDWVETMNREILVSVKVETAQGVANIEEIASVPGLDAILIGPSDLSTSLGIPGQYGHVRLREAIGRILEACRKNGIAGGPHVSTAEAVQEWADRGATFMSCGFDGELLLRGFKQLRERVHHLLGDRVL
ncbi:MAG TPA: aldolase/citrate lyase family protein [Chloroflexota bacterium]|nr:aldolase/citrate lyase family protein [Chloroflexota bacterium]